MAGINNDLNDKGIASHAPGFLKNITQKAGAFEDEVRYQGAVLPPRQLADPVVAGKAMVNSLIRTFSWATKTPDERGVQLASMMEKGEFNKFGQVFDTRNRSELSSATNLAVMTRQKPEVIQYLLDLRDKQEAIPGYNYSPQGGPSYGVLPKGTEGPAGTLAPLWLSLGEDGGTVYPAAFKILLEDLKPDKTVLDKALYKAGIKGSPEIVDIIDGHMRARNIEPSQGSLDNLYGQLKDDLEGGAIKARLAAMGADSQRIDREQKAEHDYLKINSALWDYKKIADPSKQAEQRTQLLEAFKRPDWSQEHKRYFMNHVIGFNDPVMVNTLIKSGANPLYKDGHVLDTLIRETARGGIDLESARQIKDIMMKSPVLKDADASAFDKSISGVDKAKTKSSDINPKEPDHSADAALLQAEIHADLIKRKDEVSAAPQQQLNPGMKHGQ